MMPHGANILLEVKACAWIIGALNSRPNGAAASKAGPIRVFATARFPRSATVHEAGGQLCDGLVDIFERASVPARVQGLGARFGIFFGFTDPVERFDDTLNQDQEMTAKFIRASVDKGVYFHDYGSLVAGHHGVSAQHTLDDIDEALNRIETAVRDM